MLRGFSPGGRDAAAAVVTGGSRPGCSGRRCGGQPGIKELLQISFISNSFFSANSSYLVVISGFGYVLAQHIVFGKRKTSWPNHFHPHIQLLPAGLILDHSWQAFPPPYPLLSNRRTTVSRAQINESRTLKQINEYEPQRVQQWHASGRHCRQRKAMVHRLLEITLQLNIYFKKLKKIKIRSGFKITNDNDT